MTSPRSLRVRYVADGAHCAACGKTFYPARTVSGATTEHYCSGECAWAAFKAEDDLRFHKPWQDEGGEV